MHRNDDLRLERYCELMRGGGRQHSPALAGQASNGDEEDVYFVDIFACFFRKFFIGKRAEMHERHVLDLNRIDCIYILEPLALRSLWRSRVLAMRKKSLNDDALSLVFSGTSDSERFFLAIRNF